MNNKVIFLLVSLLFSSQCLAEELSLTLVESLRRASLHSQEVLLAQTGGRAAAAATQLAKAPFFPHLSVGTGAAKTYGFPLSIEGSAPSVFEVNFTQALYDRQQRKQIDSTRLQEEGVQTEVKAKQQEAALKAGQLYLELRSQRQKQQHYQTELQSLKKIRDIVQIRVEAGAAESRELTQAKLDVARATLALAANDESLLLLEEQLKQAIGVSPDALLTLANDEVPGHAGEYSEAVYMQAALESDPDLMQLQLQKRSHEAAEEALRGPFRPVVQLVGKYGLLSRYNNFDQYFNRFQRNNALLGISIQLPLFLPELNPERRRLQAAREETQVKIQIRTNQLRVEARRELANIATLQAKEEVASLETQAARENLQTAQAKYEQGRASLIELEEARRQESSRWIDYLDVKLDQEKSRLFLSKRSGLLLRDVN